MQARETTAHRLLLIDDQDDEWTVTLSRAVYAAGIADHALTHAESVSAGLEVARSDYVDTIVLRLEPLDEQAFETCSIVASVVEDAVVVVVTSRCDLATSERMVRAGAEDCISLGEMSGASLPRLLRHAMARPSTRRELATDAAVGFSLLRRLRDHPLRILLVDDSASSRALVLAYLGHSPIEIETAANGEDAVELYQGGSFDVVLMDVHMPVLDGTEATESIRRWESKEGWGPVPIIALCGHASIEDAQQCVHAGCTDFLPKPFSRRELIETLARYTVVALPLGADGVVTLGANDELRHEE